MMHPIAHFRTISVHRHLVCRYCLRLGLIRQGLTHDLSKYSPEEFWRGARYYQGYRSPNDAERAKTGMSRAWLHHKGRNKHHFEYWIDWQLNPEGGVYYAGNKMPMRYVAEMFCYDYLMKGLPDLMMHPDTLAELEKMLLVLKDEGEDAAFRYVRQRLKESKEEKSF